MKLRETLILEITTILKTVALTWTFFFSIKAQSKLMNHKFLMRAAKKLKLEGHCFLKTFDSIGFYF